MLLKEAFWNTVAKELKKRGSKRKINEVGPFEAHVNVSTRGDGGLKPLKLDLIYQPLEGSVKGSFIISFMVEPKHRDLVIEFTEKEPSKALADIIPNIGITLEMTPEEEKAMQSLMISQYGDEDTPEPLGRAWVFVRANVVSPHGQDFMDRISPWVAQWIDNMTLLHGHLNKHIKKLSE
ncbi:MAG: hypothetical protein WCP40_00800 [Opitutae bacterium]|jgi:hypothetical protein